MKRASLQEQALQLGLFERPRSGGFTAGERVELDEHSWIEHFSSWLLQPESLFDMLAARAGWEQRSRWMYTGEVTEPRLTAEYPVIAEVPMPELQRVTADLSSHYRVRFDSAWLNLYRDHQDSTSWHADRPVNQLATAIVPVLSLGATRRFLVRAREGGKSTTFKVESGDLIVMGGRCQRDWVHMVPKETYPSGPRISVNFGSSAQNGEVAETPKKAGSPSPR